MARFLLFSLYAPMQSWGDIAVGGARTTWRSPGRSAIAGLLAGAAGIMRDDPALLPLHQGIRIAVRSDSKRPTTITDFHTAQVPPRKKDSRWRSRAQELSSHELGTILSNREYLCDAAFSVAVWTKEDSISLENFCAALNQPVFVPYLGRKSCPLALPAKAHITEDSNAERALSNVVPPRNFLGRLIASTGDQVEVVSDQDGDSDDIPGFIVSQINYRRDVLLSAGRWQFGERREITATTVIP